MIKANLTPYSLSPLPSADPQAGYNMLLVGANLDYFQQHHQSEVFRLKGMFQQVRRGRGREGTHGREGARGGGRGLGRGLRAWGDTPGDP